ncbi:MAG: hypothetical protein IJM36_06165 [Acholeplasmatales bacterium]|nr:hypothetical protein [Acholeplasmatales bacterium]
MESLNNFKKRCDSIIDKAYQGGVTLLNFLDEAEISVITDEIRKNPTINLYSDGKIIDADRKRFIVSPYEIDDLDFKIDVFEIVYNKKFYDVNHRSILGSLMSLGIKRECIGDIVFNENRAFFAATKEISSFLLEEFRFIGKAPVELKLIDFEVKNIINYEFKTHFLASIRLDSIVANGFNISRNIAQEMIMEGLVYINHVLCQNTSHEVKVGDQISVRHKGKIILKDIGGKSRSGRIAVNIGRRI